MKYRSGTIVLVFVYLVLQPLTSMSQQTCYKMPLILDENNSIPTESYICARKKQYGLEINRIINTYPLNSPEYCAIAAINSIKTSNYTQFKSLSIQASDKWLNFYKKMLDKMNINVLDEQFIFGNYHLFVVSDGARKWIPIVVDDTSNSCSISLDFILSPLGGNINDLITLTKISDYSEVVTPPYNNEVYVTKNQNTIENAKMKYTGKNIEFAVLPTESSPYKYDSKFDGLLKFYEQSILYLKKRQIDQYLNLWTKDSQTKIRGYLSTTFFEAYINNKVQTKYINYIIDLGSAYIVFYNTDQTMSKTNTDIIVKDLAGTFQFANFNYVSPYSELLNDDSVFSQIVSNSKANVKFCDFSSSCLQGTKK